MTFDEKIFWFSLLFSLKIVIIKSTHGNRNYYASIILFYAIDT